MSPYNLHCTVCAKNYNRSDDWTTHLFGSGHQNKARLECVQWEKSRKECALVAFFSCPITSTLSKEIKANGKCDEEETNLVVTLRNYLLMTLKGEQAFSGPLLLTDFVMWNEQPKMCVLQFESRERVNWVYSKLVYGENGINKQHKLGNQLVQFKKLLDLLELEWRILIPDSTHKNPKRSYPTADQASPKPKKVKTCNGIENTLDSNPVSVSIKKNICISKQSDMSNLASQYHYILKSVQIPSQIVTQAEELTEQIKNALCEAYPEIEVVLLRSHFLKIKNRLYGRNNDLLIFVHGNPTKSKGFKSFKLDKLTKLLLSSNQISGLKISTAKTITNEQDLKRKMGQRFKIVNRYSSSSITAFHLFTDLYFSLEAQMGRILNYMCQFDSRCYPVISLLHYFCRVNACYFGDPQIQGEPIEWIVITFMSNKKYLPTVRQILNQEHHPIWQMSEKRKSDIGFDSNDPNFLQNWVKLRNNNDVDAKSVLKLFQRILSFIGNVLATGDLILNVRDGEILKRKLLFGKETNEKYTLKTELTEEEICAIINSPCHLAKWTRWQFSIVHPFVVNLKLGFQVEKLCVAMKLMKVGSKLLKQLIEDMEVHGELKSVQLKNILRIDTVTREKVLKESLPWQNRRQKLASKC